MPDFFRLEDADYHCRWFTPIVDPKYEGMIRAAKALLLAKGTAEKYADHHVDLFHHDNVIVFQLACVTFKDSLAKCHFIPWKDKRLQSGWGLILHRSWESTLPTRSTTNTQDHLEDAIQG